MIVVIGELSRAREARSSDARARAIARRGRGREVADGAENTEESTGSALLAPCVSVYDARADLEARETLEDRAIDTESDEQRRLDVLGSLAVMIVDESERTLNSLFHTHVEET